MNPARLISIATQLALSSDDTPERQDDPSYWLGGNLCSSCSSLRLSAVGGAGGGGET